MIGIKLLVVACLLGITLAQQNYQQDYRPAPLRIGTNEAEPKPTPIPILKQINRHNEDGSYTYGYEGADGSFKIETKLATGEVKGKYGYVDEAGKVKVVEYGANKYGFQPSGEGITVPPPTLVDETTNKDGLLDYEENLPAPRPQKLRPSKARVQEAPQPRPQPPAQPQYYDYEEEQHNVQPQHQPQQNYQPQPQQNFQPQPQARFQSHAQQPQYQYVQNSNFGSAAASPVPPRPQIANAGPTDVIYSPKQRPARPEIDYDTRPQIFPNVAPASEHQIRYSAPAFASAAPAPLPKSNPAPQPAYAPQPRPAPAVYQPRPTQGRSTSVLDQLAKDYALPQGGSAPLHDISFGYY